LSRDAIAKSLTQNYQPGSSTSPGTTGRTTYKSWLLLWKWTELLSRNETDEARRLVIPHLYLRSGNTNATVLNPGAKPAADMVPAPADLVQKITGTARNLANAARVLLPPDAPAPKDQTLLALVPPNIVSEWTADESFLQTLFDTLSPGDYAPGVLRSLVAIRQAQPAKFKEYLNLAVAIAVVDDQKMPVFWPHRQVTTDLVPVKLQPAADWFAYWVKTNESGGTYFDLRKLTPEQLKFVVDAPLEPEELDWARKNIRHTRDDFAKTFSDITYSAQRARDNIVSWTDSPYTLANIKQQGGICVDQAYYSMIAGKAHGLPTLFFAGQGVDGGHAWFGYLKGTDRWELDCGKYINQNFSAGIALDPQTWTSISDHQLAFITENFHSRPEYAASRDDLVVAGLLEVKGDTALAAKAYDSAIAVCSRNADAWDAKTAFLERTGAGVPVLTAHHQAALRQFSSLPDLKAQHQKALAELAASAGDTAKADALTHQITLQNQDGRTDIAVDVAADKVTALVQAKKFSEALTEHDNQLTTLGRKAGGSFFYKVTQPLVETLVANNSLAFAKQALDNARTTLAPEANSALARDMQTLQDTITVAKVAP